MTDKVLVKSSKGSIEYSLLQKENGEYCIQFSSKGNRQPVEVTASPEAILVFGGLNKFIRDQLMIYIESNHSFNDDDLQ